MGAIIALLFLALIGLIVFGAPILAMIELVRIHNQTEKCTHGQARDADAFCPDCGARLRAKRRPKPLKAPPPDPTTPPKPVETTASDTGRPDAVTEAILQDLAMGLKDLGFDKTTTKNTIERLRPMAEAGASLNDLINEALKR